MNDIIQKLKDLNYSTISEDWYTRIAGWDSWYKGDVEKFHNYSVWTGQHKVKCRRYSLGMGKKVCEDWANLLMNEKVQITLEGTKEQAFIDKVFIENNFEVSMNELQEKGAARGTYAVIPRIVNLTVNEDGTTNATYAKILLDFITGDCIYPLSWRGREITECAFATELTVDGVKYVYLQLHVKRDGGYVIENRIYNASNSSLQETRLADVKGYENVPESFTIGDKPQFVIGRYNIANNIEDNNPMGVAVFANAIDVLKGCDIAYDSYVNEFVLGKKRVMVKPSATKRLDGEDVFDPNDVTFYVLPEDVTDGSIIQPIDMALRVQEHTQGLQDHLNMLSAKCGFGEQHYKFDQGSVATATQIVSENSTLFRSIKKHEIVLESLLIELCRIILRMGNTYMSAGLDENVEISVDFDDSIIEDKATDEARVFQMLSAGLMRADEARSILMNEDIETAREALPNTQDLTDEGQSELE